MGIFGGSGCFGRKAGRLDHEHRKWRAFPSACLPISHGSTSNSQEQNADNLSGRSDSIFESNHSTVSETLANNRQIDETRDEPVGSASRPSSFSSSSSAYSLSNDSKHGEDDKDNRNKSTAVTFLLEIVGARGLIALKNKPSVSATRIDPYVIVRQSIPNSLSSKEIHRTKAIPDDEDPIWTIKTKSLCLLQLPLMEQQEEESPPEQRKSSATHKSSLVEIKSKDDKEKGKGENHNELLSCEKEILPPELSTADGATMPANLDTFITLEVWSGHVRLGSVRLNASEEMRDPQHASGERVEYDIIPQENNSSNNFRSRRHRRTMSYDSTGSTTSTCSHLRSMRFSLRHTFTRKHPREISCSTTIEPGTPNANAATKTSNAKLALRFRQATVEDLTFMHRWKNGATHTLLPKTGHAARLRSTAFYVPPPLHHQRGGLTKQECKQTIMVDGRAMMTAGDINFRSVRRSSGVGPIGALGQWLGLGPAMKRVGPDKVERFRVQPHPDPNDRSAPKYLTRDELNQQALQPSRIWTSAGQEGYGTTVGRIFLEIIGCDDLPDMDAFQEFDLTDAFVGVVFEDNMLRTPVVWDDLNPRFMPWTTRAFCFHVRHASSILMLGVFDHDDLDSHDPIGRVVINPSNFQSDVTHVLFYNLTHDPREEDQGSRGTLIVRLRIQWLCEQEAAKQNFRGSAPSFVINVDNAKSYNVLTYLTRGAVDMEKPSLTSVRLYINELLSYWVDYCFFLDVLFEMILWRGRWTIGDRIDLWCPIRSVALFVAIQAAIEYPQYIVPILLYSIAATMMSVNYYASHHANPWKRVKSFVQVNRMALTGRKTSLLHQSGEGTASSNRIEPNQGSQGGKRQDQLDKLKAARMAALIEACLTFALKVYRIYSKTKESYFIITTKKRDSIVAKMLASRLHYLHMLVKYLCKYIRLVRNFINWKTPSSDRFTMYCILIATVWIAFPVNLFSRWVLRILAWSLLGPWMKLIDIFWVHSWYRTKEELLAAIDKGEENPHLDCPNFDSLLHHATLVQMGQEGRVAAENSLKLQDMRDLVFGHFCERVPAVDTSRFPSVPLPQSWAEPIREPAVPGQRSSSVISPLLQSRASSSSSTAPPPLLEVGGEEWYTIPGQRLQGSMIFTIESDRPNNAIPMTVVSPRSAGDGGEDLDDHPHQEREAAANME